MKKREEKLKKRLARKNAASGGDVPGDLVPESEIAEGPAGSL